MSVVSEITGVSLVRNAVYNSLEDFGSNWSEEPSEEGRPECR